MFVDFWTFDAFIISYSTTKSLWNSFSITKWNKWKSLSNPHGYKNTKPNDNMSDRQLFYFNNVPGVNNNEYDANKNSVPEKKKLPSIIDW